MKKSANVILTLLTVAAVTSCTTERQVEDKELVAQDTTKTKNVSSTPAHHTTVYPWYLFWRNWGTPKPITSKTTTPTRGGFGKNGITHPATS